MNPTDNPWQKLASKLLYDNPWISVREDQVLNPAGGDGIYGVVHFKNLAIGVIPVDTDGNTWLVGQYRYALEQYCWEIPMGGSPLDSEPLDGAMRELREETGLRAAKWQHLMKVHTSNSVTDECGHIYLATELTMGETSHEDTEQLIVRHLPLSDAIDMVNDGIITDCISIAGLLRLHGAMLCGEIEI